MLIARSVPDRLTIPASSSLCLCRLEVEFSCCGGGRECSRVECSGGELSCGRGSECRLEFRCRGGGRECSRGECSGSEGELNSESGCWSYWRGYFICCCAGEEAGRKAAEQQQQG